MSSFLRGVPSIVSVDGEQITLTPCWDAVDGESVEFDIPAKVNLSEAGVARIADVAKRLLEAWRPVWPLMGEATL